MRKTCSFCVYCIDVGTFLIHEPSYRARMQSYFVMLASIAIAIISPAKQSIIGAIYSFPSLHGNERYVGQLFFVRSIRAKVPFQKIFRLLSLSGGFSKSVKAGRSYAGGHL